MKKIEQSYNNRDLKQFHKQVKKAASLKNTGNPVKGIEKDNTVLLDKDDIACEVKSYYQKLYQKSIIQEDQENQNGLNYILNYARMNNIFTKQEIDDAMQQCNFNKSIGVDGFDGLILQNQQIKTSCQQFLQEILNDGEFPQYFNEGKLILLSKKKSSNVVALDQTRPIVVNSHLRKICEKVLLNKLKNGKSQLFQTQSYQTGFKEDSSTHKNISKFLHSIIETRKKRSKRVAYILVDLQKAYDNVDRAKLFKILWEKAQTNDEKIIVSLIANLGLKNKLTYENEEIITEKGVIQGSVISPFLFNIYLEHALLNDQTLVRAIKNKNLIAFADDLLIKVNNQNEFNRVIQALLQLESTYGLKLNKEKTVFLSDAQQFKDIKEIQQIKKVQEAKYLGLRISLNRSDIVLSTKNLIKKQLGHFKSRIKIRDGQIRNHIFTCYIRSLVIYYMTPMVAVDMLSCEDVDKFEAMLKRQLYGAPGDIKSKVIMNITTPYEKSTKEVVRNLSQKLKQHIVKQQKLSFVEDNQKKEEKMQRQKIYVARDIMDLMMAVSQNRTCLHYEQKHYCYQHKVIVDKKHIDKCELINELGKVTQYNQALQQQNLRFMKKEMIIKILTQFGWLKQKLLQLEKANIFRVISVQKHPQYIKKGECNVEDMIID